MASKSSLESNAMSPGLRGYDESIKAKPPSIPPCSELDLSEAGPVDGLVLPLPCNHKTNNVI